MNDPEPLLRTLAPLLRGLDRRLRGWLDARRAHPLSMLQRAELEGLDTDLQRQADAVLNLVDAKKASLVDLEEFFRTSRQTLDLHREMLEFEPEIEIPEEAPATAVP